VILAWILTLLIDRKLRFRASGFDAPILAYLAVVGLSLLANVDRVEQLHTYTLKSVSFLLSYVLVFYFVLSVLRTVRDVDSLVRLLVACGGVVGFFALVESATRYNVFNHLGTVFPALHYVGSEAPETTRGGGLRVYGSAQHPIALGAAFAMLIPLAIYLARRYGGIRWQLAGVIMLVGLFATRSRTGVTMLLAMVVVYLILRWRETLRFWPAVIPLVLTIHFAVPGAIGSLRQSFFPQGGLIAQEDRNNVGSGRLATFGPVYRSEFKPNPVLGEGYATRVVHPEEAGLAIPASPITDDEWLSVLAETGLAGALAFGWILVRSVRKMSRGVRKDRSPRSWLLVGTSASVVAYGVGMWTYDSFAFIQVSFLLFIILAIGAATLLTKPEEGNEPASARQLATPGERLADARG